jgi:AsmA protein
MLKFVRWLGGFVLTATLLLLFAIIILPNVIDPNDYRDELATLVKDKTGRDLNLSGNLSVSVFPWLGVKTQGLTLSQPEGIDGDLVSVQSAQLRVKLMPLLNKRVEVDTVVLESPMIKLVTLKSGLDSFSGLSDTASADADLEEGSATAAVALVIQGIELSNGTVVIDNRQQASVLELTNLNLTTGNLIGEQLAGIRANGELKDSESNELTNFEFTAKALIDTDTLEVNARDLQAKIEQNEFQVDLQISSVSIIESAQIEAQTLSLVITAKDLIQETVALTIPHLIANLETQTMSADAISAKAANLDALISNLKVRQFIDKPSVTGAISVPKFNARSLLGTFDLDYEPSDPSALKFVSLSSDFAASLEGALVQKLVLNIDNTQLTGSGAIVGYENPKFKFDLNLNELNFDQYLPEESENGDEVSGGEALLVPMALFKDVNANGAFRASRLIVDGVVLTDINVNVESSQGRVAITPKATLYEGKLEGAIVFSQSGEQSSLSVKNDVDLVQLSPLLNDAIKSDMLRGLGTLGLDLVVTEVDGVQHNEGTIELRAKNGALSGVDVYNIVGKLNNGVKLFNSLSPGQEPELSDTESQEQEVKGAKTDNTEFSDLIGTFYLKDFIMTNDDLKFKGPGFEITGGGQFDLERELIDYRVNLLVEESISRIGGDEVQKLLGSVPSWMIGKQVPVRCKGSFESPSCLPDISALYSFYIASKIENEKSQLLQDKLGITIEEGKTLRTRDVLKQLILKEVIKDDKPIEGDAAVESRERPIGERDAEFDTSESQGAIEPPREKTKKELRDERKRKLLESIFN